MEFNDFVNIERRFEGLSVKEVAAMLSAYEEIKDVYIYMLGVKQDLDEDDTPIDGSYNVTFGAKNWVHSVTGHEKTIELAKEDLMKFLEELDQRLS